jgi:hypothetical protein
MNPKEVVKCSDSSDGLRLCLDRVFLSVSKDRPATLDNTENLFDDVASLGVM